MLRGEELSAAYASADIFMMPSETETLGFVALEAMATLRPEIDAFFDKVMVMDPDPALRAARLALLSGIVRSFSGIADFSEIVTAG